MTWTSNLKTIHCGYVTCKSWQAFLLLFLLAHSPIYAQQVALSQPVSVVFENNTLHESFEKITVASQIYFSYDPSILPSGKTVSAVFQDKPLRQVLDFLLKKTDLSYTLLGNHIIIKTRSALEAEQRPKQFTISGYVRDSLSGEELIGANIWESTGGRGCSANLYGFYSITLEEGDYQLTISYLGYNDRSMRVHLNRNLRLDLKLNPRAGELAQVIVTDSAQTSQDHSLGKQRIPLHMAGLLPAVLGEKDVLKMLQLLPGVSSGADGLSSFGVRGGSPDQTLILLDEAPLYNPTHMVGFFSVFNNDALKEMKFMKGAFPAQYGGRLSSVLEVHMKEGNAERPAASGGIGLTSSRLLFEAPIFDKKGSFMASGRRTYLDWFFKGKDGFHFFDSNVKANVRLGEKDRLFVAGYFGRDVLRSGKDLNLDWGNTTTTLRWNHLIDAKSFLNTSLIFSDYRFKVQTEGTDGGNSNSNSGIRNLHLKQTYQRYANPNRTLTLGWSTILHDFEPGEYSNGIEEMLKIPDRQALESALFGSQDWQVLPWLSVQTGLRLSNLSALGTGQPFFHYDESGEQTDSIFYEKGKIIQQYWGLEPRASLNFRVSRLANFQAGFGRSYQYVQLVGNSIINNPVDVWLPASPNIRPQVSDQLDAGFFLQLPDNQYQISVEAFYKKLQNQLEYRYPDVLLPSVDIESRLTTGQGRGYGTEFMLKKTGGRLQGWLGYAWARHRRQFEQLNDGQEFPARFDFTHSVSAVGAYKLGEKWTFAAVWTYRTGSAVTVPAGKYQYGDKTVVFFGPTNGYRLPAYHRLDISFSSNVKRGKHWESNWVLGFYNVYARRNPIYTQIDQDKKDPGNVKLHLVAPLLVIPAISWEFRI